MSFTLPIGHGPAEYGPNREHPWSNDSARLRVRGEEEVMGPYEERGKVRAALAEAKQFDELRRVATTRPASNCVIKRVEEGTAEPKGVQYGVVEARLAYRDPAPGMSMEDYVVLARYQTHVNDHLCAPINWFMIPARLLREYAGALLEAADKFDAVPE